MTDISTRFFGLALQSPVIAASSSMTGDVGQVVRLAEAGAGAVVLKSLFEEEIYIDQQEGPGLSGAFSPDPEYLDYFDYVIKENSLRKYLSLISEAKSKTKVPIVASINCVSLGEWAQFARRIEDAGADALELNLFVSSFDLSKTHDAVASFYIETTKKVLQVVNIPVTIKISHYFSNLSSMVKKLAETNIAGITVFNRFFSPDIDIFAEKVESADVLSSPNDYLLPLKWTGILSGQIKVDLAATTGIHSGATALKFLLSGASAVQIASVIYHEGPSAISRMNQYITEWMEQKGYQSIADFKGSLSYAETSAQAWERSQFMKHYGGKAF